MIQINPDFQKLIPPLSSEEKQQLESNLIADGCRDPLVLWGDTLIDGHNRFEICTRLNIPYQTISKEFESENAVKLWMIDNQRGRRNLTDGWRFQLVQAKKEILAEIGKAKKVETLKQNSDDAVLSIVDKTDDKPKHDTRAEIAKDLGWSTGKVGMADVVFKEAEKKPELKEKVLSGEVSINEAYKEIKAEKNHVHVAQNSGENEWYTPAKFIESARLVMGSIDLDPATSEIANKTVQAEKFFTKDDNGLEQEWSGNVWMNPPYAQPLMNQFAEKLINELPNINQAIVLVNNATETKWFQSLLNVCSSVCFTSSRIKFLDPQGNEGAPLQGQAIIYFGENYTEFKNHFSQYGIVLNHA